jgi:hypothetical protein
MIRRWQKFFLLATFFFVFVFADKVQAFSLSPTKYLVTVDPGSNETIQIYVKNNELKPENFKILIGGLKQTEAGGLLLESGLNEAEKWIVTKTQEITIPAGTTRAINFDLNIPAGAYPGSYVLGLAVETQSKPSNSGVVGARLFTILLLQVAGEAQEVVSIENFSVPWLVFGRNWPTKILLKNNGNVDTQISGEVTVWRGENRRAMAKLETGNRLLPGIFRNLDAVVSPAVFWPGRYELQLKIMYGLTAQTATAYTTIWYFPFWSWAVLFLICLLIIFLVYLKKKNSHE